MKTTYDIELIKKVIVTSKSIYETTKKLRKQGQSITPKSLRKLVKEHNIPIEHLLVYRKIPIIYTKICPKCKKKFQVPFPRQIACSRSCANKTNKSGENHRDWKGGFSPGYYRKICFEKYDHKCLVCNESNIVDVHHIDGDHKNNDIENLLPLCPTHHRYMHYKKFRPLIQEKIDKYNYERNFI